MNVPSFTKVIQMDTDMIVFGLILAVLISGFALTIWFRWKTGVRAYGCKCACFKCREIPCTGDDECDRE